MELEEMKNKRKNRERTKFRAWDDVRKEYTYYRKGEVRGSPRYEFFYDNGDYSTFSTIAIDPEIFALELCSGMVHKITGDIYEGDIGRDKEGNIFLISFNLLTGFWARIEDKTDSLEIFQSIDLYDFRLNGADIVGNVRENPELLPESIR